MIFGFMSMYSIDNVNEYDNYNANKNNKQVVVLPTP